MSGPVNYSHLYKWGLILEMISYGNLVLISIIAQQVVLITSINHYRLRSYLIFN